MNSNKLIYFALCALAILVSCSQQDELEKREYHGDSKRIYFRSYLPAVTESRAQVLSSTNFNNCQVTAFNIDDDKLIHLPTGNMTPYFFDVCFSKADDGRFLPSEEDSCFWPDNESRLHFFAYYPSVDSMKQTVPDGYFNLVNSSKLIDDNPVFDFKINNFRVATDIAKQVDFITAYAKGTLAENANKGIELKFKHHLARVEIAAWSANEKYDFEIAGVRIGNPLVEGDFNLSSTDNAGPWENTSGNHGIIKHIFEPGETIVLLSKDADSHSSENDAVSIMGSAGAAMVIPMNERIEQWEGKNDPAITATNYSTDKMYFSVLLRVKNKDNEVAYPYSNDRDNMTVVYFAIDNDNKITQRLYKIGDDFYTAPVKNEELRYTPADSEEICGFGWAALPVAAKWEAGKIYTYKLNYSTGIGWHDPADPKPGEPIIERGKVPFSISVEEWTPADDYNSDITVPKR